MRYVGYSQQNPNILFSSCRAALVAPRQLINRLRNIHQPTITPTYCQTIHNMPQMKSMRIKQRVVILLTNHRKFYSSLTIRCQHRKAVFLGSVNPIWKFRGKLSHFSIIHPICITAKNCSRDIGSRQQTKKPTLNQIEKGIRFFLQYLPSLKDLADLSYLFSYDVIYLQYAI